MYPKHSEFDTSFRASAAQPALASEPMRSKSRLLLRVANSIASVCSRQICSTRTVLVLVATLLVFPTTYATAAPIVVDAHATACIASYSAHFTTIQSAVNAAPSGADIAVCPGTYPEQITINKPMTLTGVTVASANTGAAVIVPPAGGLSANGSVVFQSLLVVPSLLAAVQVLVQAPNVTLVDLAVDGAGANTNCLAGPTLIGVGYGPGASGTLRRVAVRNQYLPFPSGGGYCESGVGGQGVGVASLSGDLTILDSSIRGFSTQGVLSGGSSVIKTTVFSPVSGTTAAQCVVAAGGVAPALEVSNNTISNCGAAGVTLAYAQSGTATVSGNTIVNTGLGIHFLQPAWTFTASGNTIAGAAYAGISCFPTSLPGGGNTIQHNDISAPGTIGIDLAEPFCANNTITNNTINDASYGITGASGNNVSGNTFLNVTTLTTQ